VSEKSEELKGPEILAEIKEFIHLITVCMHFSKKPFPQFLEATGYSQECVLLQEAKAGVCFEMRSGSSIFSNILKAEM
jgi:hypothetical protein